MMAREGTSHQINEAQGASLPRNSKPKPKTYFLVSAAASATIAHHSTNPKIEVGAHRLRVLLMRKVPHQGAKAGKSSPHFGHIPWKWPQRSNRRLTLSLLGCSPRTPQQDTSTGNLEINDKISGFSLGRGNRPSMRGSGLWKASGQLPSSKASTASILPLFMFQGNDPRHMPPVQGPTTPMSRWKWM